MNPFTDSPKASVATLGESALIDHIRDWLGEASPPAPAGMGDDCAVISHSSGQLLVTVDPVIYGRHFDDTISPEDAGAKLLKRNLSDIAAMGGKPLTGVLALTLSPDVAVAWLERFIRGLGVACIQFSTTLAGGDVAEASGQHFAASLTLLGTAKSAVTRTGATHGDHICVTGELGGSILGKHAACEPRLAEGQWLAARSEVMAMMDITDGLAKDLPAMLPDGSCAKIATQNVPLAQAAHELAKTSGQPALAHALCDGEDYELLVMLDRDCDLEAFLIFWAAQFDTRLTCIGTVEQTTHSKRAQHLVEATTGEVLYPSGGYQHLQGNG